MTFRQILQILWRGKWLGLGIVALVMAASGYFATTQAATYSADVTYRVNPLVSSGTLTGDTIRDQVDFELDTLRSPTIMEPVADRLGVAPEDLRASIEYQVKEGTHSDRLTITATADSAEEAQRRVREVGKEYSAYLTNQIATGLEGVEGQKLRALEEAQSYQRQRDANPDDALATANLATAIAELGRLTKTIETIHLAGPPLTVVSPVSEATEHRTSFASVLVVAFVAGLVIACAVILVLDQFDNRIKDESELDTLTNLAVLGSVPRDKRLVKQGAGLPTAVPRESALNESFRSLRTAVEVVLPPDHPVVVFTSVAPGEGKTLISANLALTWQRAGKRVILVGGDLRKPNLPFQDLRANGQPGLSDLLLRAAATGEPPTTAEIGRGLRETDHPGLRVLPAGKRPANPSDLLATEALPHLLAELARMADIVVVDAPPALGLADAALLGKHASGVVVVASMRQTRREELVKTLRILGSSQARLLGLIANRSRHPLPDGYDSYYFAGAELVDPGDVVVWDEEKRETDHPDRQAHGDAEPAGTGVADDRTGDQRVADDRTDDDRADDDRAVDDEEEPDAPPAAEEAPGPEADDADDLVLDADEMAAALEEITADAEKEARRRAARIRARRAASR